MTVKLAKLFTTNFNVTTPPLPPPKHTGTHNSSHNYYHYQPHPHHEQQQQHQQQENQHQQLEIEKEPQLERGLGKLPHCNLYYDDEDDSMSMYSTTASIMTTRDHPFNNSQRPLLPARKPPQLLHKKKLNSSNEISSTQQPHSPQQQKSYISPYVQQQKRDSAKGLHGFNDFDILSQQYNQHLQSPHIGYPYGSPPSPTAISSDFIFDELTTTTAAITIQMHSKAPTIKLNQSRYANITDVATNAPTNAYHKVINAIDYCGEARFYGSESQPHNYMGKASRFEDDFCSRRNDIFSQKRFDAISNSSSSGSSSGGSGGGGGGPFIFGDLVQRLPPPNNGREFTKSTDTVICSDRDYDRDNHSTSMTLSGKSRMQQQSTSDTSSSSQDTTSSNVAACNSTKGARFHLLRKSKSKNKIKKNRPLGEQLPPDKPQKPIIKCVLVGDGAVGKTNLILSYLENRFNPEHVPTASDIYNADVMVNDSPVHLTLCDTAGQDTLDPLRELCYPDSDVFLLCFSVVKPETFHAIKTKWAPKFSKTKVALVLVGTQADLRTNPNVLNKLQTNGEKPISYADAWDLAASIGAKYIETSSATQEKVKEVFDTAIWDGLLPSTLPPTPPFWKKLLCLA